MLKEYMVALKKGVDYNEIWNDIENPTAGLPHIPDRAIGIANNLDALDRITHYFLTDEEALQIIEVFFNTEFEGGRHQKRIEKIPCL